MSERFSPLWWNEQAKAAGGLTKADVEALTGMEFPVRWNSDGTIPWDSVWPKSAELSAPGMAEAGLLLHPVAMPSGYPYRNAEEALAAQDPNWGGWNILVSAVGTVAPGAEAPWTPVLPDVFTTQTEFPVGDAVPLPPVAVTGSGMEPPASLNIVTLGGPPVAPAVPAPAPVATAAASSAVPDSFKLLLVVVAALAIAHYAKSKL